MYADRGWRIDFLANLKKKLLLFISGLSPFANLGIESLYQCIKAVSVKLGLLIEDDEKITW